MALTVASLYNKPIFSTATVISITFNNIVVIIDSSVDCFIVVVGTREFGIGLMDDELQCLQRLAVGQVTIVVPNCSFGVDYLVPIAGI